MEEFRTEFEGDGQNKLSGVGTFGYSIKVFCRDQKVDLLLDPEEKFAFLGSAILFENRRLHAQRH